MKGKWMRVVHAKGLKGQMSSYSVITVGHLKCRTKGTPTNSNINSWFVYTSDSEIVHHFLGELSGVVDTNITDLYDNDDNDEIDNDH